MIVRKFIVLGKCEATCDETGDSHASCLVQIVLTYTTGKLLLVPSLIPSETYQNHCEF